MTDEPKKALNGHNHNMKADEPKKALNGHNHNMKENPRECKRHSHGHKKQNGGGHRRVSIDETQSPPSPILEEVDIVDENLDVIKLDERPLTGDRKSASSRPGSRKLDSRPVSRPPSSRPASVRSAFEHIPGTRPASRRTISRSSNRSRKSRTENSGSPFVRGHSSDSDSEHEEVKVMTYDPDFQAIDIHDEKGFDTDLEVEATIKVPHVVDGVLDFQSIRLAYCEQAELLRQKKRATEPPTRAPVSSNARQRIAHLLTKDQTTSYDHSGKTSYIDTCKKLGVVPASYFLRHMNDRELSMRHHGLGASGMKALAESLSSNTTILELDLGDNWLGPQGGMAVCDMLKDNCFITSLNLSDNRLGTECAYHLSQIMQNNVTITHVTLSGNDFDDNSAPYFADALMNATKIQFLDLSHNNFGDGAGITLGPAIADNTCLKEFDISWNCIRRKGAIAVTQGVKNNVYMKKLNLSWNGFGLEGATGLQDALKGNSVLEELDISNNRITPEGAVLIGKGLSMNESLRILRMGKNPMQSAGCYGVCAAILRNPNCVIEVLDFNDILVNKDFEDVYKQVQDQIPNIKLIHGGMEPPQKPKAKVHPMVKLVNYIEKHELRLVDFFNKFDKDGSMSVTHEEFVEGIEETGIKLTEDEIQTLLEELDRDGDGEINYNELVVSHMDFQEKKEKINTVLTVMQPRPVTS